MPSGGGGFGAAPDQAGDPAGLAVGAGGEGRQGEQAAAEAVAETGGDGGEAERCSGVGGGGGGAIEGGVGAAGEPHHQGVAGPELVGEEAGEEAGAGALVGRGIGLGAGAGGGGQLGRFFRGERAGELGALAEGGARGRRVVGRLRCLGRGGAPLQFLLGAAAVEPAEGDPDAVLTGLRTEAAQRDQALAQLLHETAGGGGEAAGGQLGRAALGGGGFVGAPIEHGIGGGSETQHQPVAGGELVGEEIGQHGRAGLGIGGAGHDRLRPGFERVVGGLLVGGEELF